jgi:uncharacterized SAM-binding protein YcdF (DUF218 family)
VTKILRVPLNVFAVLLLGWILSVAGVVLWGKRDTTVPSDAIVVLGAAQYVGRPSPVLRSRLDHAHALWQRQLAERLILTGGQGAGDTISEAEVGRVYLRRKGVPERAMLVETKGRSTDESLQGVARLMQKEHLQRAILVSDPFHMLRLRILAWSYGLDVSGSPTKTSPISANRSEALTYVLGESIKVPASLLLTGWRAWRD